MGRWDVEKSIDYYYGEYKKKAFMSKKVRVALDIYPSKIEVIGFDLYNNVLSNSTVAMDIPIADIISVYIDEYEGESALFVEYKSKSIVFDTTSIAVLFGLPNVQKWTELILQTKNEYCNSQKKQEQLKIEKKEEEKRLALEREKEALEFYEECYNFHIKEATPRYTFFSEKNKIALMYIGEDKSLNFLKIDGYGKEENNGVIQYNNIHYFDKAGNVSYVADIHGNYSSFGGSMTGGKISKLATIGGGLLFGLMGMGIGAALTYKPAEQKPINTTFTIDSDIRKIDDRNILLNFYSELKRQYVDIELPQDMYNFFQTYLPEKKYSIVDELEKKTIINQSLESIQSGSLLKVSAPEKTVLALGETQKTLSMEEFKDKVEKLKIMKEAGLLSEERFEEEQAKLLNMI